jgi:hypothetical protein
VDGEAPRHPLFSIRRAQVMIVAIGCSSSSGSHFLSYLLNDHPEIACGDELYLYPKPLLYRDFGELKRLESYVRRRKLTSEPYDANRSFLTDLESYGLTSDVVWGWIRESGGVRDLVERFEAHVGALTGKRVWAEKTPQNIKLLGPFLAAFPEARVIHIVRDPRDVLLSLMQRTRPLLEAAETWLTSVAAAWKHRRDARVLEIRYEDLILSREATLERLCRHLGVEFRMSFFLEDRHPSKGLVRARTQAGWQLRPGQGFSDRSVGKWKGREAEIAPAYAVRLAPEYAALVEAPEVSLADLAREYGYEIDPALVPPYCGRVLKSDKRRWKKRLREYFYERARWMPKVTY